jgi:hypothetical protein
MRLKHYLALLGLCAVAPGCTPLKTVAEVMICEPAAYCLGMDDFVSRCRNNRLAEEAWTCFESGMPNCEYSADFADGFKTGFCDFLYAGGNGDPPVVPPRSYWKPAYETPQGQLMMQDWFRGYRHGAAVARESGYRDTVVLPASAALPPLVVPTPPSPSGGTQMPRADEVLPPPQKKDSPGLPPEKKDTPKVPMTSRPLPPAPLPVGPLPVESTTLAPLVPAKGPAVPVVPPPPVNGPPALAPVSGSVPMPPLLPSGGSQ